MERVPTHEIDRRESQPILAMRAVIGKERFGSGLEFPVLCPTFLRFPHILLDHFFVLLNIVLVLFQPMVDEMGTSAGKSS